MAKSLRSKWKRKMRAVKRERYGQKELKTLNDMLAKAGELGNGEVKGEEDQEIVVDADSHEMSIIKSSNRKISISKRRSRSHKETEPISAPIVEEEGDDKMSVDSLERIFNKKTMRDQFGNYPNWMNKRKMRTQQKKNKRLKKKALKFKK